MVGETNFGNLYYGILVSNYKEQITATCYHMDEHQRHYAKLMKSETKDHVMYNFIYMIHLKSTKTS